MSTQEACGMNPKAQDTKFNKDWSKPQRSKHKDQEKKLKIPNLWHKIQETKLMIQSSRQKAHATELQKMKMYFWHFRQFTKHKHFTNPEQFGHTIGSLDASQTLDTSHKTDTFVTSRNLEMLDKFEPPSNLTKMGFPTANNLDKSDYSDTRYSVLGTVNGIMASPFLPQCRWAEKAIF